MIHAARATGRLICVSAIDFLAPYHASERRRHEDLCLVLRTRHGFPLTLEDFLSAGEEDDRNMVHTIPLEAAELRDGDCLLVVNCAYEATSRPNETDRVDNLFTIAEDSLSFNLIEALA
jgi:hypothetical protein